MTHRIEVVCEPNDPELAELLVRAAEVCLEFEQAPDGELSVVLADEDSARELNRRFRHIDKATDVLSFADGSIQPEDKTLYFGDIVICREIAARQAKAAGHPVESELALLTVHGVLHLLGHDHTNEVEKQAMWTAQSAVLKQLGLRVEAPA